MGIPLRDPSLPRNVILGEPDVYVILEHEPT